MVHYALTIKGQNNLPRSPESHPLKSLFCRLYYDMVSKYEFFIDTCDVMFINETQATIMSAYVYIGMIQMSGYSNEMAKLSSQIPAFLQKATCELGGSALSLNAAAMTTSQTVVQVMVWAPKAGNSTPDASNPKPDHDI